MLFVHNDQTTNPYLNSALEEYLLRHTAVTESFFLLYVNDSAVVMGRNQNIYEETNPDYLKDNNIHLVRRLSGGGTVYHDTGNLNFSFIVPGRQHIHQFETFTASIVRTLQTYSIQAEMKHNGSLFVGDKKISGHAQYVTTNRLLSHGTLLFDADLTQLSPALKPRAHPTQSNAVASIRSPVMNLRPLLPPGTHLTTLRQAILQEIFGNALPTYELTTNDWQKIKNLAADRYETWDWTYGRNPRFVIERHGRCDYGPIETRVEVNKGYISHLEIYCDFFDQKDPALLAEQLIGCRYEQTALTAQLQPFDLTSFFGSFSMTNLLALIY